MDNGVDIQSSGIEIKPEDKPVAAGSVWIDDDPNKSTLFVEIAQTPDVYGYTECIRISVHKNNFTVWGAESGHSLVPRAHPHTHQIYPAIPSATESALLAALENIECPDCGHLLKCHADKHGCDIERGDKWVEGTVHGGYVAQGPCSCTCEDLPDLQAAVEAIRLAKGGQ